MVGMRGVDDGRLPGCRGGALVIIGGDLLEEILSDQVREAWMPNPVSKTVEAVRVVWDYDHCGERRIDNLNIKFDIPWVWARKTSL